MLTMAPAALRRRARGCRRSRVLCSDRRWRASSAGWSSAACRAACALRSCRTTPRFGHSTRCARLVDLDPDPDPDPDPDAEPDIEPRPLLRFYDCSTTLEASVLSSRDQIYSKAGSCCIGSQRPQCSVVARDAAAVMSCYGLQWCETLSSSMIYQLGSGAKSPAFGSDRYAVVASLLGYCAGGHSMLAGQQTG